MKKTLLIFVFLASVLASAAQTTLDTALNFSVKDTEGNTLELFDILNQGQLVVIDFFSTA